MHSREAGFDLRVNPHHPIAHGIASPSVALFAQRYDILPPPLGSGTFGHVWRAVDTLQNFEVAVKVFGPGFPPGMVFREAALLTTFAKLPHCLQIFNADKYQDVPYISMELADKSLSDVVSGTQGVSVSRAKTWTREMLVGLESCHAAGFLHRDVKPANIFLMPGGSAKLGDFGLLERVVSGSTPWAGTPSYLPPESVAVGSPLTVVADIYGSGLVLWELLTGRNPFAHATTPGMLVSLVVAGVPSIRDAQPHVPRSVATVIETATAKNPGVRYASAQEMHQALGNAASSGRDWGEVVPVGAEIRRWECAPSLGKSELRVIVTPNGKMFDIESRHVGGANQRIRIGCIDAVSGPKLNARLRRIFDKL
jgi:serine/threonine-protein kinase